MYEILKVPEGNRIGAYDNLSTPKGVNRKQGIKSLSSIPMFIPSAHVPILQSNTIQSHLKLNAHTGDVLQKNGDGYEEKLADLKSELTLHREFAAEWMHATPSAEKDPQKIQSYERTGIKDNPFHRLENAWVGINEKIEQIKIDKTVAVEEAIKKIPIAGLIHETSKKLYDMNQKLNALSFLNAWDQFPIIKGQIEAIKKEMQGLSVTTGVATVADITSKFVPIIGQIIAGLAKVGGMIAGVLITGRGESKDGVPNTADSVYVNARMMVHHPVGPVEKKMVDKITVLAAELGTDLNQDSVIPNLQVSEDQLNRIMFVMSDMVPYQAWSSASEDKEIYGFSSKNQTDKLALNKYIKKQK